MVRAASDTKQRCCARCGGAAINVPRVLREFSRQGNRYLALEKFAGRALTPRPHANNRGLHAQCILSQVAAELHRIHAAGWVWRDCKPSHIFLSGGRVRLIDFEGACPIGDTAVLPWGSPDYVPPAHRGKFGRARGTAEDDYALGVTVFELATGALPPRSAAARARLYRASGCPEELRTELERRLRIA